MQIIRTKVTSYSNKYRGVAELNYDLISLHRHVKAYQYYT